MVDQTQGHGRSDEVRAAGGAVWRRVEDRLEVLLVHRPRYDDWSLPKGKLDPGEGWEEAAIREVAEETGLRCRLGVPLADITYRDRFDRPKVVRYWAMEVESDGGFEPHDEVDEVRWATPDGARDVLTYPRDAEVVDALEVALR